MAILEEKVLAKIEIQMFEIHLEALELPWKYKLL